MAQEKKNTKTHISEQIPSDCVSSVIKGRLPDTVSLGEDDSIIIIDQTKLPLETRLIKLQTQEEIYLAIKTLQVRGAPAIGVTAEFALYLAAKEIIKRTRIKDRKIWMTVCPEEGFFIRLCHSFMYMFACFVVIIPCPLTRP